jgi:hypothetical protein
MAQLEPGTRIRSAVRDPQVMVIAAPAGDPELLCTEPGRGSPGCDATLLGIKGAKPLPASD